MTDRTAVAGVTSDALVVFTPSGRRGRFGIGTTVLQAARSLGVDLDSVCGGRGICGRCQVEQSIGEFAKHGIVSHAASLSPTSEVERRYAAENHLAPGRRLGCACEILSDAVIDVPPDSQVHRQVVRKRAEVHHIELDPAIRLYYVEVPEPNMHDPSGDLQRLYDGLEFEWGLTELRCDLHVLTKLQGVLRKGGWRVTVAIHNDSDVVALWPEFRDVAYGLAVDVGSTTIAAHLCDLTTGEVVAAAGVMNPQIRFGEDLMSRVSYVMMNPGGEDEMTRAVRDAIRDLLQEVAAQANIHLGDVLDLCFVGNPIMHHLLVGLNPVELGGAPFALATDEALNLKASDLELGAELGLNLGARVYILPCIAGHVGADAAGVVLSEGPYQREALSLLVDVGTNAEIVLGNKHRLLACSSPTGPAFEGAQVSGGQRAAPGAIERVRIDPDTLEPRFKIIGCDLWSDEEGFSTAASTGVTGICGSGIIEVIAEMYLCGVLDEDGVVNGALAKRTPRVFEEGRTWSYCLHDGALGVSIRITQNDVRAIQLAKAALYAGVRLLMDRLRVERVDRIRLAGAFGSHIDVKYAMVLGMVPDCRLEHVTSAGNAAGTGARIALLDRRSRAEIESLVRRIEKVETAVEPKFQAHFVEAMAIPHKSAAYPELEIEVKLPSRYSAGSGQGVSQGATRRRRRRSR